MTEIANPLQTAAKEHGDELALIDEHSALTYYDYWRAVRLTAKRLADLRIDTEHIVAVNAPAGIDFVILLQAIWSLGAVAAPVRDPETIPPGCSVLISDSLDTAECGTVVPLAEIVRRQDHAESVSDTENIIRIDRPATLISTSGSSGQPRWVQHRYAAHLYSALGSNDNIKLGPGNRWLICLPLHHVSGLSIVFRTMLAGAALVIKPDRLNLVVTIARFEITHLSLVSAQLKRVLDSGLDDAPLAQIRAVLVGGSAIPAALIERAWGFGLPLFTTYGSTEMASQVTTNKPGDPLDRLLTSGRPLAHREISIAGDGEIQVRGRTRFDGYVSEGRLTVPFDPDGWFATGDIGRFDEQGYLIVEGRRDRMFISGGENIHPEQIEKALLMLTEITEAIVVPLDDPEWGQRPVAALSFGGKPLREAIIRAKLREVLPRHMVPDSFFLWEPAGQGIKPSPDQVLRSVLQNRLPRLSPDS